MCKHKPGTGRCSGNSMTVSCSVSTPPCPDQNSNMPLEGSSSCNKETTTAERSAAETSNFFLSSENNNESMCSKELKSSSLSDKNVNGFINNSEQTSASTNAWFNSQETKTLELKPSESTSSYRTNDGASHVIPSIPLWSIREEKEGIDFNKMECSGSTDLRAVSTPDIPCGSEESLLPNSDISTPLRNKKEQGIVSKVYLESPPLRLVGYDPSEIDLIRFSPSDYSNKESNENEHLLSSGESGSCMFRCSDDIGSDDEGNNTIDNDCESLVIQNYNFTPIVTMISHDNDNRQCATPAPDESSDLFLDVFFPKRLGLPQVKSAAEISVASSVSQKSLPICRICHLPASEDDTLISPCRCSGTMQYIHNGCLLKWLEICCKRSKRPPSCELCLYQYHRHKKFKVKHWELPQCSRRDKILHIIFIVSVVMMISCATATILCFKHDKGVRNSADKSELTKSEIITLVCGVLFFIAFFVAMYVEVKSRNTLYKLLMSFLYLNQQWYIDEYDKKKDIQPVPV